MMMIFISVALVSYNSHGCDISGFPSTGWMSIQKINPMCIARAHLSGYFNKNPTTHLGILLLYKIVYDINTHYITILFG